ncbi:MAG: hypothetical protein ACK2UN_20950 [Candidatus Promineifilaceae bacterium]
MKARLVPVYFAEGRDQDFDRQLSILKNLLAEDVSFCDPVPLGDPVPQDSDAVIFPQFLGEAYHMVDEFKAIDLPILVVTSEFGTVLMWDWEICSYLRSEGINTIAPYSLEQTRKACRALGVKRELNSTKFLVFQDNPGVGMQSEIFKRFYWFEDECIQRMIDKFGIQLVKKSYKQFAGRAMSISDEKADDVIGEWLVNTGDITTRQLRSAVKIYIALSEELDNDPSIRAVGINCLNESRFSDTTPCLAWSMLYEERRLIWGCEADIMSMITKYLLHNSLGMPIMMTNLYPFLMGQAALAHERIPHFPEVETAPEDHILAAHCGYLGVLPTSFATEWALRKKVLAIVDDNATAIDGRLPEGPMTLAKIQPTLQSLMVMEGSIEGYVQYPDSDCLTGGVLRISDGYKLVNNVASHHYLLMTGHQLSDIQMLGQIFDLGIDIV